MRRTREHEPPMPDALAYFLTWSTYGTWLPGDERGWIEYGHGWKLSDPIRTREAEAKMTDDACRLDGAQRDLVERQIVETCHVRGWEPHAVNCRSNHVHVVVTATQAPKIVRNQLKAWCTRRLKELEAAHRQAQARSLDESIPPGSVSEKTNEVAIRENWWAERGSQRFINDTESLEAAIFDVRDGHGRPREH